MFSHALVSLIMTASPATGGSAPSTPAPPSAADSVVAAAFKKKDIGTKAAEGKASLAPSFSAQTLAAPILALGGLAALAFTLKRRKHTKGSSIHIIEASPLGERRSLVIADVLGERLVLAVSEAGVTVLMNHPAPLQEPEPYIVPAATSAAPSAPVMGFFARLRGRPPALAFDTSLQESIEDQELRSKLASGVRSFVP